MLPMHPNSHEPNSPNDVGTVVEPPATSDVKNSPVLEMYLFVGSAGIASVASSGVVHVMRLVLYWIESHRHGIDRWNFEPMFIVVVLPGVFFGITLSIFFWLLIWFWPAIRNPIRAGVLCASLLGSLALLEATVKPPVRSDEAYQIIIQMAGLLLAGAVYGSVTILLARVSIHAARRFVNRRNRLSNHPRG